MPPLREGSASLSALKELKPAWEMAWQQVSQALAQKQGSIGLERAVQILADMRAKLTDALSMDMRKGGRQWAWAPWPM